MDMRGTIIPHSDQLNSDDLISGPRTFTIERVDEGNPEQPVNIHLVELPGRPYKPSKSMRRVLTEVWGWDSDAYLGRRLTLYRNEKITFGRDEVGGIQISHVSHLDKRRHVALTVKRGQKKPFTVEPLPDAPAPVTQAAPALPQEALAAMSVDELRTHYTARQNAGATTEELDSIKALATTNKEN